MARQPVKIFGYAQRLIITSELFDSYSWPVNSWPMTDSEGEGLVFLSPEESAEETKQGPDPLN